MFGSSGNAFHTGTVPAVRPKLLGRGSGKRATVSGNAYISSHVQRRPQQGRGNDGTGTDAEGTTRQRHRAELWRCRS